MTEMHRFRHQPGKGCREQVHNDVSALQLPDDPEA